MEALNHFQSHYSYQIELLKLLLIERIAGSNLKRTPSAEEEQEEGSFNANRRERGGI